MVIMFARQSQGTRCRVQNCKLITVNRKLFQESNICPATSLVKWKWKTCLAR